MTVKADLHVHSTASDGISDITELVKKAKKLGLDAIAVCDHNMCTELTDVGLMCIPATEISTDVGHVVGLFVRNIDFDRLRENGLPSAEAAVNVIHENGGLAVLAHPFEYPRATPEAFDGIEFDFIETANSRAPMKVKAANGRAREYAAIRGLPETGGSDAHSAAELGGSYTEIECREPADIECALREGKTRAVHVRTCKWTQKGYARLVSAVKKHNFKAVPKACIYLMYAVFRDIFGF